MNAGTVPTATARSGGGRGGSRRLVAVFAVTQTVGYGVLYYAFSVLLTPMADDLDASTGQVTFAATIAVLAAATAAVPIGRWLDRRGGRTLMTAGSLLGVAAVVLWSQVTSVAQLYAVFALIGLASAMSLYEAAFSVLIANTATSRRNSVLLAVTIVAGFASSIFFPLTGWLTTSLGWRDALLVLAALLAATALPGHLLTIPGARSHRTRGASRPGMRVSEALRDRGFWLLAGAFTFHAGANAAAGVLLVTFLFRAGHSAETAATLAGLLGILSVAGRLTTTALAKRFSMAAVAAAVFTLQAAGAITLANLGHSVIGAAIGMTAFGIGFGVATIARPAIVAERYGTGRYATIAASMTVPLTAAKAAAPVTAALTMPGHFMIAVAVSCLCAATLLAVASRLQPGLTAEASAHFP